MQLNLKKLSVIFLLMLTLIGSITAIMTYANLPEADSFVTAWLSSLLFAFLVLLPIGGFIFAGVNKFVSHYFSSFSTLTKGLIQGAIMAIVMESLLAVVTTVNNHTYSGIEQFFGFYVVSFIYALPVGFVFACLMTLIIKPKLELYLVNSAASTVENS